MSQAPYWAWIVFLGILLPLLALDLLVHRHDTKVTTTSAAIWSGVWVGVGLAFAAFVWPVMGGQAAGQYVAAWLIEKSLSVDNLFVFLVIFKNLSIPPEPQRRALSWGIFGALAFRAIFIFAGVAAIERWQWLSYVFGGILLLAAWRIFREDPTEEKESRIVKWLSNHLPVTHQHHGDHFVVREAGRLVATPLLIAVIGLELTDVLFAVDSVPAALAISHDTFIIYTSNAFAILGLRALYLLLASVLRDLRYLHYGLAGVLGFAALKMMLHDVVHLPAWLSILIIATMVGVSVVASFRVRRYIPPPKPQP